MGLALFYDVPRSHSLRRTTIGRTHLEERLACHRDLHLSTHNAHKRQISMTRGGIRTCNPLGFSRLHTTYYVILQCFLHISAYIDPIIMEKNTRERMYKFVNTPESFSHCTKCSLKQLICSAFGSLPQRYGNKSKYG